MFHSRRSHANTFLHTLGTTKASTSTDVSRQNRGPNKRTASSTMDPRALESPRKLKKRFMTPTGTTAASGGPTMTARTTSFWMNFTDSYHCPICLNSSTTCPSRSRAKEATRISLRRASTSLPTYIRRIGTGASPTRVRWLRFKDGYPTSIIDEHWPTPGSI